MVPLSETPIRTPVTIPQRFHELSNNVVEDS